MNIKEKRVLITGASSGIGRALASEFARQGAVLAIIGRRADRLSQTAGDIAAAYPNGARPIALPGDITDPVQVRSIVRRCGKELGGLDVLVNNAGISVYGETERTSLEDFRAVLEINFLGALNCTLAVLPQMRRQGSGLVVNIASLAALHGVPYLAAYSASKAALAATSQSLRAELHGSGINVLLVYPGYTDTDIFKVEKKVGGARRPPKPYTPPAEVARAVVEAVKGDKHDLVFTPEGKALNLLKGFVPITTEKYMMKLAKKLKARGGEGEQA